MRPLVSTVTVDRPRGEVFDHLDVLANHEQFTDHYLRDWACEGPACGVGARARMRAVAPGTSRPLTMEVVSATRPERIVEESVDPSGTRRGRGTFVLDQTGSGTRITFTFEQLSLPWVERILAPLTRAWLRRANDRALRRLAERLAGTSPHDVR